MTGKRGHPWHHGSYGTRAAEVRQLAYANPHVQCWRCGRTLTQLPRHRTGRRARWTAGHVVDGQVDGMLVPECSLCACRTGAERGNRLREPRSENPY